ncbi:S-layer homology domain-containing protein [Virgibacillus sp. FSP13]
MKKVLFSTMVLLISLFGISTQSALASGDQTKSSNLSIQETKQIISETAREYGIPPEILKAIAAMESEDEYKQFNEDGTPVISSDGGIGVMQVTPDKINIPVDIEKLKTDIDYNIDIGARVLMNKWNLDYLPKINSHDKNILEDWYFAIMAYNGLSETNDPNLHKGKAYQERVYKRIESASLLYGNESYFEFPKFTINYEADNDTMFFPPNKNYETGTSTTSREFYQKGDIVYIDGRDGSVSLREGSYNGPVSTKLWSYTPLTITGDPVETSSFGNEFAYYPVSGVDANGFVASAYLNKGSEDLMFTDPVDDKRAAALAFAAKNGYVKGYPDGSFGSNDPLKRKHVAVILDKILSLSAPDSYQMVADDVPVNHKYYEQLRRVEYHKLLGGGGKLRPKQNLTRAQMAEVMAEAFDSYYEKPEKQHIFIDQKAIWNPEKVNTIYYNGVTVADPFRPGENITRSQFALFIYLTMVDVE